MTNLEHERKVNRSTIDAKDKTIAELRAALEKAVNIVQAYNRLTGKGADTCAEMCASLAKATGK